MEKSMQDDIRNWSMEPDKLKSLENQSLSTLVADTMETSRASVISLAPKEVSEHATRSPEPVSVRLMDELQEENVAATHESDVSLSVKIGQEKDTPPLKDITRLSAEGDSEQNLPSASEMTTGIVKDDPEKADPGVVLPAALVTVKMEVESEEEEDDKENELQIDEGSGDTWNGAVEKEEMDSEEEKYERPEPVTFVRVKEECMEEEEECIPKDLENEECELQAPTIVTLQIAHEEEPGENLVTTGNPLDLTVRADAFASPSDLLSKAGNPARGSACPYCKLLFVDMTSVEIHAESCLQTLKKRRFKCETCGALVSSPASLRRHKQTHTGKRPHKCDMCDASFKRLSHLRDHKLSHTGEKKHVCTTCGAAFTQLSNLRTHERHHNNDDDSTPRIRRLFRCEICCAEFSYNSSLKQHLLNHTGERPHKCDTCGMTFKQLQSLTVHKRRHTGERPFQCDTCGMTFAHPQGLRVHLRIHTGERPYKCDVCGSAFTQLHSLSTHKRRHYDVRPYTCDICNASFVTKDKMTYHIRIHTGEKPYPCPICGKAFTTASDLTRHKRIHFPKVKTEESPLPEHSADIVTIKEEKEDS